MKKHRKVHSEYCDIAGRFVLGLEMLNWWLEQSGYLVLRYKGQRIMVIHPPEAIPDLIFFSIRHHRNKLIEQIKRYPYPDCRPYNKTLLALRKRIIRDLDNDPDFTPEQVARIRASKITVFY